jgi:hypothetical protein
VPRLILRRPKVNFQPLLHAVQIAESVSIVVAARKLICARVRGGLSSTFYQES